MKTNLFAIFSAAALSCVTLPARADQISDTEPSPRDRDVAQSQRLPTLGDLRRVSHIIGSEVKDASGRKLGTVKDLALDMENGRIVEVIMATGGSLAWNHTLVAIPPASFACDETMNALRLNATDKQLNEAPEFDMAYWKQCTAEPQVRETYQCFGAEAYFTPAAAPALKVPDPFERGQVTKYYQPISPANNPVYLGTVVRATKLMGATAHNLDDERLGRVDNLIVELPAGRLTEVILGYGGVMGTHDEKTAVPPQAFIWNEQKGQLTLDVSAAALRSAPHYKGGQNGFVDDPASIAQTYALFHVQPYFANGFYDSGAQNVRERVGTVNPDLERANNADLQTTDEVRKAILDNDSLSPLARDVKVITVDGKVTLIGQVESEQEKRMIGEAAIKVVPADKIENQLQVHTGPTLREFH